MSEVLRQGPADRGRPEGGGVKKGTQAERVQILLDLTRELQKCGTFYLATLLVTDAYAYECLQDTVFGEGSLDAAALKVNARLRRLSFVKPVPAEPPERKARKGATRRQRADMTALLEQIELRGAKPKVAV